MTRKMEGKVALVTGSSRGIGRATALLFAREGATVVVNCKSKMEMANDVIRQMEKGRGIVMQADVSKETEVKKLVGFVLEKFGRIDILVNNAGEIVRPGDWKCDCATWKKTIDVNLTSAWLVIREVAPCMQHQKAGAIVNLTSTVGMLGSQYVLAYSCAKNGLIALTKSFAKELAPYVRVNAVAPSNVMTDMTHGAGEELIERFRKITPLQRIARPEELAHAILFLASDDASYITGHVLVVDGGYSLK